METPSQIALVFAAQAGDRTAFGSLVKPFSSRPVSFQMDSSLSTPTGGGLRDHVPLIEHHFGPKLIAD